MRIYLSNGARTGLLVALASAAALGFAFFMQYGRGLDPCHLCLWQRWPYGATILTGFAAAGAWRMNGRCLSAGLLALSGLIFLGEAGLALFHAGVEQHWWPSPFESCSINFAPGQDLLQQILNKPPARCDEIAWSFLGLSMAAWNVPFALTLAAISFTGIFFCKKGKAAL